MIAYALIAEMEVEQVADLEIDNNLFWEEIPLQKNGKPAQGVWFVTRGGAMDRSVKGLNLQSTIDVYVSFGSKPKTEAVHQAIRQWLSSTKYFCQLSGSLGGITYDFENVRLRPTTTPQNYGSTENGLIVKVASVDVFYDSIN